MPLLNWIEYQAQASDWNVTTERDNNTSDNPAGRRRNFRFQLDGLYGPGHHRGRGWPTRFRPSIPARKSPFARATVAPAPYPTA